MLYHYVGDPPPLLIATTAILLLPAAGGFVALIWMAAAALLRFEAHGSSQATLLEKMWTFCAIGALGIGIWFIYGRAKYMLSQPRRSEASP